MRSFRYICIAVLFSAFFLTGGCLPSPPEGTGGRSITLFGFSIMKEALEKEIVPAFVAKWKREHGEEPGFVSSFAGSETITNQILQGAPADVAILSIERDADRLVKAGRLRTIFINHPIKGSSTRPRS